VHPDVPGATLCPHKLRFDAENPSCMYLENHPGAYRTSNEGRGWVSIENGLPSDLGFPIGRASAAGWDDPYLPSDL
jgi:hypothetical protein